MTYNKHIWVNLPNLRYLRSVLSTFRFRNKKRPSLGNGLFRLVIQWNAINYLIFLCSLILRLIFFHKNHKTTHAYYSLVQWEIIMY